MAGLLLAEIVLRLLRLAPTDGVSTVNQAEFRRIPGIFAPNRQITDRRLPALTHRVTIDSLGYRSHPVARRKPAGEVRILFVGDSFTYGDFVSDDETLPAQLERRLQRICSGRTRVINAGLGGSTIVEHTELIERGMTLHPDMVVLMFSENDVEDLGHQSLWHRLAENRAAKSRFPLSVAYPVLRHTALWNLGLKVAAIRRRRARPPAHAGMAAARANRPQTANELKERYRKSLLNLRDRLSARGITFMFAVYPSHLDLNTDSASAQEIADAQWAVRMAEREGIATIDFLPALRASGLSKEQLYLLPHDGHASARGYAIAAGALARALAQQAPIPGTCRDYQD